MTGRHGTLSERFWRYVAKGDGCWVWTGSRTKKFGYGRIFDHGVKAAHIVSYELHFGRVPEGMQVCHRCDNSPCVRPDHLFLGTAADNSDDCYQKGRAQGPKGEQHPKAKLTADAARAIYARLSGGDLMSDLAREYGITHATVRSIRDGATWWHATGAKRVRRQTRGKWVHA